MSASPDFGIRRPREHEVRRDTRLASGLNLTAGLWLLASPLALEYGGAALWNALLSGAVITVLAGLRTVDAEHPTTFSWVNLLLGVWLVSSPFALDTGVSALWNFLVVGGWVGFWALVSATSTPRPRRRAFG